MAKQGPGTPGKPTVPSARAIGQLEASPAVKGGSHKADSNPAPQTPPVAANADEVLGNLQIVFGENLRAARLKADLSQAELAAQTGLTQQYLSLIETGYKNVTLRTMEALAKVVGQEVSAMLRRPGGR
jgi:DNA-binding XRE family transcriptional regulator